MENNKVFILSLIALIALILITSPVAVVHDTESLFIKLCSENGQYLIDQTVITCKVGK